MKTERSHRKGQNFRDAPGRTLKLLQLSQAPFLKLQISSFPPWLSKLYNTLPNALFSLHQPDTASVSLTNTQAQM